MTTSKKFFVLVSALIALLLFTSVVFGVATFNNTPSPFYPGNGDVHIIGSVTWSGTGTAHKNVCATITSGTTTSNLLIDCSEPALNNPNPVTGDYTCVVPASQINSPSLTCEIYATTDDDCTLGNVAEGPGFSGSQYPCSISTTAVDLVSLGTSSNSSILPLALSAVLALIGAGVVALSLLFISRRNKAIN